jgi:acyl carrier protein
VTREEIQACVLRNLGKIAPEADLERLEPDVEIRRQIDIDSMDFLNFVISIHESLGVEVPEEDYPRLATLKGCVAYIAAALAAREADRGSGSGGAGGGTGS